VKSTIRNLVYNVILLGFVADISIFRRGSKHYKPLISGGALTLYVFVAMAQVMLERLQTQLYNLECKVTVF
jgi:hypothetical protein